MSLPQQSVLLDPTFANLLMHAGLIYLIPDFGIAILQIIFARYCNAIRMGS